MTTAHSRKPPYTFYPDGVEVSAFVYRNLHKGCWSVKDRYTGRVIALLSELYLCGGVTFHVSSSGRARVLSQRVKNVHAGVRGRWKTEKTPTFPLHKAQRVRYNPYAHPYFTDDSGREVCGAAAVHFRADGSAWADGIVYGEKSAL